MPSPLRGARYYGALYPHFMWRRVLSRGLYRFLSGIVLHKLRVIGIIPETLGHGRQNWAKTIACDIQAIDDPLPDIVYKHTGRGFFPLTGYLSNDGLIARVERNEHVGSTLICPAWLDLALFLNDLVQWDIFVPALRSENRQLRARARHREFPSPGLSAPMLPVLFDRISQVAAR